MGGLAALGVSRDTWDSIFPSHGCRFLDIGGVYKLAFGPKAFIVVSDPVVVRHLLKVCAAHGQMCALALLYLSRRWCAWPLQLQASCAFVAAGANEL